MTFRYAVSDIKNHPSYTVLTLRPEDYDHLEYTAGQYATISAKNGAFSTCTRCFSIVSSPNDKLLQIAFRRGGELTESISRLGIGDMVNVQGPFGSFVLDKSDRPIVMFAGGIGITPFISMLRDIADKKSSRKVILVASNSSPEETPLLDEIINLSRELPNLKLELFSTSSAEGFRVGRLTNQVVTNMVANTNNGVCYICGSEGYSNMVKNSLVSAGVSESDIMSESFSQIDKLDQVQNKVMKYSFLGFLGVLAVVASGEFIKSLPNYSNSAVTNSTGKTNSATGNSDTADGTSTINQSQTYTPPTNSTYIPPSSRAS